MAKNNQARRPVMEFRVTPPVMCSFEVDGEVRELGLKLTNHSMNVMAQSEHADAIARMFGGAATTADQDEAEKLAAAAIDKIPAFARVNIFSVILQSCMAHLPKDEQLTLEQVTNSVSFESLAYYAQVFSLLVLGDAPKEANPTSAGKPAKAKANGVSSISTGQQQSLKPESSSDSVSENLPN
jgi:hypothetical protein